MSDGLAPRRAAALAYLAVMKQRRTLEAALEHTPDFNAMSDRDRAFARAITATTFRRLGQTRTVLNKLLSRPLDETSKGAEALLVTGATQLLWMEGAPHAVVSSTVDLAQERPDAQRMKGLINAVLRRVDREGASLVKQTLPRDNLPEWLRDSWRAAYGPGTLSRIANAIMTPPPLDLTLRNPAETEAWAEKLEAEILPNGSLRRNVVGDVRALPGYEDGAWWAQDAAAAIPATLLDLGPGKLAIDLCAAPGGKTLQLAATGADVTALDLSEKRLQRVRENLDRTGLDAQLVAGDAREFMPPQRADAVLLDAPCTATGTLRRHPEAGWIKQADDTPRMARLQDEMIKAAADMLKPGGQLVLCTCSLQPEEGEALAGRVVGRNKQLKDSPIRAEELPGLESALTPAGWVRLTPALWAEQGGMDGFFIARFVKRAG
ncbi:transcription antitermination factor NusB [Maricaulis sp.]|jgi:16S rRNA (cytosine967-C5)-methyltransferase|uniref:RsmB/NOP family class I SAM-dependent RNA methyltransferase n=1 Tax=Maricaulis sp. TaxID=1486257 RepID=UPI0025F47230|nr:transcription antitermination factor NusB [Maricaulis sp.]MDF1767734.1 transcription antitermination factor NusB [Maricaulis sp.]